MNPQDKLAAMSETLHTAKEMLTSYAKRAHIDTSTHPRVLFGECGHPRCQEARQMIQEMQRMAALGQGK